MKNLCVTVAFASILAGFACAAGTQSGGSSGDRNVLSQAQMMETQQTDVYSAIQQLRPQWLRARGAARISGTVEVVVFVDDVRRGGIENLRSMRLEGIDRVQFLTATEATTRYGTDVAGGVILVTRGR